MSSICTDPCVTAPSLNASSGASVARMLYFSSPISHAIGCLPILSVYSCAVRAATKSARLALSLAVHRAEPNPQDRCLIVRALLYILFLPGLLQIAGQIRPLGILGKDDAAKLLRALGELFLFRRASSARAEAQELKVRSALNSARRG